MATEATSTDWSGMLKAYTLRNTGRRTRLEIDDPAIGAQWSEIDFPLRGVAFDSRDNRIEIMLGEERSLEARLTHSIEYPVDVSILEGATPGSEVLCIRHGRGQTLLQFV